MDKYFKISVPGPQGYSFLVATGEGETEETVINSVRMIDGVFDLEEDAGVAVTEIVEAGDYPALESSILHLVPGMV